MRSVKEVCDNGMFIKGIMTIRNLFKGIREQCESQFQEAQKCVAFSHLSFVARDEKIVIIKRQGFDSTQPWRNSAYYPLFVLVGRE